MANTRDLLKKIFRTFSDHLGDEAQRHAIVEVALFGSPTLENIEWRGASYPFAVRLTKLLIRFDAERDGDSELIILLQELKTHVGQDRARRIDELIDALDEKMFSHLAKRAELALNYVFISYTHHDSLIIERLRTDLDAAGVKIWTDVVGLKPGTPDWEQAIRDAIQDARGVILAASPQSRQSLYVRDEIAVAEMLGKPIYAVWVEGEHWPDSIVLGKGSTQRIDARGDDYDTALQQLIEMFADETAEPVVSVTEVADLPADFVPRNPYKGLRAFRHDDQGDFFGRDGFISQMLDDLNSDEEYANFLPVVGASGSGKSSVMMAGLLPVLRRAHPNWIFVDPVVPGSHPIRNLTRALAKTYTEVSTEVITNSIGDKLYDPDKRGLAELVIDRVRGDGQRIVLYIDQFEELFTLTTDENERQQFIDVLTTAVTEPDSRLVLLLSMRADFYDRPLEYPALGRLMDARGRSILPMALADLQDAIVQPAQGDDVRLTFDDRLVSELVFAVREQSGALPLLQFALDELFQRRDGRRLTMVAYDSMGGLHGALAEHAQATYDQLPEDDRAFVQPLFLRLIEPGQTEQDTTRRRAAMAELETENPDETAALKRVADTFVDARLLLTDNIDGVNTIEVSHEALIREWDFLQRWLDESREDIRFQGELSRDVDIWVRRGQKPDDDEILYRGTRLDDAETWMAHNLPSQMERTFIAASRKAQDARTAADERRIQELRTAKANAERARQEAQTAEESAKQAKREADANLARANEAQQVAKRQEQEAERASTEARESTQRAEQQRRRARRAIIAAALLIFVAVGAGVFAFLQTNSANDARVQADIAQNDSRTQAAVAEIAQAQFDKIQPTLAAGETQVAAVQPTLQAANATLVIANTQIADVESTLSFVETQVNEGEARTESLRLASLGLEQLAEGPDNSDIATLLTIRALSHFYTEQANLHLVTSLDRLFIDKYFIGHAISVTGIDYSSNGRQAISGSWDGTLILWDVETGEAVRTFSGHMGHVESVAFSPDGTQMLSGSRDTTLMLWDVETGEIIRTLSGHTGIVQSVAFSPDGSQVLSGANDGTLILWDVETGEIIRTFIGHRGLVNSVAFSPDGTQVLSGSGDPLGGYGDRLVVLWDIDTAEVVRTFSGHTDGINSVAFSPDGTQVLSGSDDGTTILWAIETGEAVLTFPEHVGSVKSVKFSPDGTQVLTGGGNGIAMLWDIETSEAVRTFAEHVGPVNSVVFSPDGTQVLSGSQDGTVILWNIDNKPFESVFTGHTNDINSVAFSPDGVHMLSGSADGTAIFWDVETGEIVRTFDGHADSGGEVIRAFGGGKNWVNSAVFSPDGTQVLSGLDNGIAILWDVGTGEVVRTFSEHTDRVSSVAFSPDGTQVLSGSNDSTAILWDVETGEVVHTFSEHTSGVESVMFSPDGTQVLSGSNDSTIILWDVKSGQVIRTFSGHTGRVSSVAFSPDGTQVLSGSNDSTIILWDVKSGQVVHTFSRHTDTVSSVTFSPDGTQVLSGSQDGTAILWDIESSNLEFVHYGDLSSVGSVAFSPDGTQALSGFSDGTVMLWETDNTKLIEYACSRVPRELTQREREIYRIVDNEPTCTQFEDHAITATVARVLQSADRAYDSGNYESAINAYSEVIRMSPQVVDFLQSRAFLYRITGQYNKAILDYDRVIELESENSTAYGLRGIMHLASGDFNQAAIDFDSYVDLAPGDFFAYYWRGVNRVATRDTDLAKADLERALELSNDTTLIAAANFWLAVAADLSGESPQPYLTVIREQGNQNDVAIVRFLALSAAFDGDLGAAQGYYEPLLTESRALSEWWVPPIYIDLLVQFYPQRSEFSALKGWLDTELGF